MHLSISVVIPTRNRPDDTLRAVKSALTQSLRPIEVIVVDDGSTDQTAFRVRSTYQGLVHTIRHDSPVGANAARNSGVAAARGQLVALLDSDDAFDSTKLEQQAAKLQSQDAPFSVTGWRTDTGQVYVPRRFSRGSLLKSNTLGGASGFMAKRSVLIDNPFDPEMFAVQDWELYLRLSRIGPPAIVEEPLYTYSTKSANRITEHNRRRTLGHFQLYRKHIKSEPDMANAIKRYHRLVQVELARQARPKLFGVDRMRILRRLCLTLNR